MSYTGGVFERRCEPGGIRMLWIIVLPLAASVVLAAAIILMDTHEE